MATQGTRQRMIQAAKAGFRARGVTATGFTDIVERAGAARGAIYHHFPGGKLELVHEVIRSTAADVGEVVVAVFERSGSAAEAMTLLLDLLVDATDDRHGDFGCPVTPAVLEAAGDAATLDVAQRAFAHWQRCIADGLERAGHRADHAAAVATLVVASVEGALVLSRAARSAEPLRQIRPTLIALAASTD